jgi:hypothetical protein
MADDAFYSPGHVTAPRRTQQVESLWTVERAGVRFSAVLRFHGENYGWEAQLLRDGELAMGRCFILHDAAVRWADGERVALQAEGWRLIEPGGP